MLDPEPCKDHKGLENFTMQKLSIWKTAVTEHEQLAGERIAESSKISVLQEILCDAELRRNVKNGSNEPADFCGNEDSCRILYHEIQRTPI